MASRLKCLPVQVKRPAFRSPDLVKCKVGWEPCLEFQPGNTEMGDLPSMLVMRLVIAIVYLTLT